MWRIRHGQLIKNHFGENHPVYACGLNNLALMYKSLEDYDEAAIYYDKALQIYEDVGFEYVDQE